MKIKLNNGKWTKKTRYYGKNYVIDAKEFSIEIPISVNKQHSIEVENEDGSFHREFTKEKAFNIAESILINLKFPLNRMNEGVKCDGYFKSSYYAMYKFQFILDEDFPSHLVPDNYQSSKPD